VVVHTLNYYVALYLQHVIIGLDNRDVFADLDLAAASSTQFMQEEEEEHDNDDSDDEESDFDEDFEEVVKILDKMIVVTCQHQHTSVIYLHVCVCLKTIRRVCLLLIRRWR
jgi:hypothetical protein